MMKNNSIHQSIVNHSILGAGIVLLYASKFDDVEFVISISSRYNMKQQPNSRFTEQQMNDLKEKNKFYWQTLTYPSGKKRDLYIRSGQMEERAAVDMNAVTSIKSSKVLIIHGTNDPIISHADGQMLQSLIPNSEIKLVEGANHSYTHHRKQLDDTITEYLLKKMKNSRL